MTIGKVIERVDAVKPNAFDSETKVEWLNALEGRIAADVLLLAPAEIGQLHYAWPADKDTELLVVSPHEDIYNLWLQAKIDEQNGEYNKYQNTMQIYNEHFGNFVRWFASTWDPAQGYLSEEARRT